MPAYIVDPTKFHAEGAVVNWAAAAKRLGITFTGTSAGVVELRWFLSADLGLPTGPFAVWTRASKGSGFQALTITARTLQFAGDVVLLTWTEGSMATVVLNLNSAAGGSVYAFGGSPISSNIVAFRTVTAGTTTIEVSASVITSVVVSPGVSVTAAQGIAPAGYANAADWTLLELVGLPVSAADWGGIGKHGEPQGLAGALSDAPTAAVARLVRGAPPIGWGSNIAAGVPAPPWAAPAFTDLIDEVNTELLAYLRDIAANRPPDAQAAQGVPVFLPPPQNSAGQSTNKPGTNTQLYPLSMTYMAASTDPFLSLALGFGTAFPFEQDPTRVSRPPDFLVTAHWENGFDGISAPVDYAVVIPSPGPALPPAAPANIATDILGALRPLSPDGDWRESVRLSWDRPPSMQLLRTVSCAAARVSVAPPGAALPLLEERTSGGYRPIVVGAPLDAPEPADPEWWRVHVMDREIDVPSNPGTRQLKYGAATQDIYGQWSVWAAADRTIGQPDLEPVRMMNPKLTPVPPASGSVCSATLEVDFVWDWRIRTPKQITFAGRLYAAAAHGDPPPNTTIPAGLDRSLSAGGAPLTVTFVGDMPSCPGVVITPVTEDGATQAPSFGPAQGTSRRYHLTLSGLALDFASTGFIGLALWAAGQENISPNRLSPYSDITPAPPLVTSTGDPRPPVVSVYHVTLGSIPDASGSSHVQISWAPAPNAVGYSIYEAAEADLLAAWNLPEPSQSDTLDTRLLVIRNAFKANPLRRPFTRWNARALTGTNADIALPRGSSGIHLFVVLGVSAGQVESDWPSVSAGLSPERLLTAVAAPHISRPAAPTIEVQQVVDTSASPPTYQARVLVTTRPGPRPATVELYRVRVDDAAKEVDTMGPPLVRLQATSGPWHVATVADPDYGTYIDTVTGLDAPPGSWKRVWYRATAWTREDDSRGGLPGRSQPSNAAWVVLPPPDGPTLSALAVGGGSAPADFTVAWTCAAPLKRTPLGPHKMSVRATVAATVPPTALIALDTTLDALPTTQAASGSGVWIAGTSSGLTTYRAIVRRAALTDAVRFAVRITDPLGRSASQGLTVEAGPVDPAPDLSNLRIQKLLLPSRTVLSFTSSASIQPLLDGPYVLKVTGVPPIPVMFPPPLSFTMPLGDVPTKLPIGPPPSHSIIRSVAGPPYRYEVVARTVLKGFVVRITGPDGTWVQESI